MCGRQCATAAAAVGVHACRGTYSPASLTSTTAEGILWQPIARPWEMGHRRRTLRLERRMSGGDVCKLLGRPGWPGKFCATPDSIGLWKDVVWTRDGTCRLGQIGAQTASATRNVCRGEQHQGDLKPRYPEHPSAPRTASLCQGAAQEVCAPGFISSIEQCTKKL